MSFPSSSQVIDQIVRETSSHGWSFQPQVIERADLVEINSYFEEHRGTFQPAKVGKGPNKIRKEEVRGDYTLWVDPIKPPRAFSALVGLLDDLKLRVNRELLLGVKDFECHLAFYPSGTFYKTHIDRFSADSSRVFSFVFYLHEEWKKEWGGELVIYDRQGKTLSTISPEPGSMVCFLSDEFPHEVKPAARERRSFTGWMHTKILY